MSKISNFNAGPAILPAPVLEQVQAELRDYHGRGMSIMEMSHRSKEFEAVNAHAEATFKRLLGVGDGYRVLFLQGGASTQFAMVPMNFLPPGKAVDFLVTGSWAEKAFEEAAALGQAHSAASTKGEDYRRVPHTDEIHFSKDAAYVHITSNETIHGIQWPAFPDVGERPLVGDMSSDIMSRPIDANKFSLIYAGDKKTWDLRALPRSYFVNPGSARPTRMCRPCCRYATHVKNSSLYNTPPAFGVYVLDLVLQWIEKLGGLKAMADRNAQKASIVYAAIDKSSGFFRGHALPESRSNMNITFRLANEELEKKFLAEARAPA